MFRDIVLAFWFFVPAGAANAAPIIAAHTPALQRFDYPLDCRKSWRGQPLLGKNKTWRGLIAGILLATAFLWIQQELAMASPSLGAFLGLNYSHLPLFLLGPLFGIGALGGDAVKSFLKRRVAIAPGSSWFPFDQLDFIIGASIASAVVVQLPVIVYVYAFGLWMMIHLAASFTGYLMGVKARPI